MGGLVFGCIAPHGGLLIPEIAGPDGQKAQQTRAALAHLARRMALAQPETIVVITPHGLSFPGAFTLLDSSRVEGAITGPLNSVQVEFSVDNALNEAIAEDAGDLGVPVVLIVRSDDSCLPLDWGAMVPLWFLGRLTPRPRVVIACTNRSIGRPDFPRFGRAIRQAAERIGRRIALIASADLGHAHLPDGPYGFDLAAAEYDAATVEAIQAQDLGRMLCWDEEWLDRARPDALWQILSLHGAIEGQRFRGTLLSYEVPTYFGMLCAAYEPREPPRSCSLPRADHP